MAHLQKAKEKVLRSAKKTRETLHLHGIAIPGWLQVLIWAIGVAVFSGLAVNNLVALVSDYVSDDENVAIQTRLEVNEMFPPPHFVMKVSHYVKKEDKALGRISAHLLNGTEADCYECQQLANVHWDVWREANISKKNHFDVAYSLTGAFMRKLILTNESDFDALDEANSEWNAPIVDAGLYFLIWRYTLDRYFETIAHIDSLSKAMESVNSDFANFTVDGTRALDSLRFRILKALCQRMTLNLTYPGALEEEAPPRLYCHDILLNSTLPVIIDDDSLWIPLPINSGFESKFDFTLLPHGNSSMWIPSTGIRDVGAVVLYADPLVLYFSEIDDLNDYWWYVIASGNISNGKWPRISVDYSVSMRTREERPHKRKECYHEISPKVCVEKCSKQWTIEQCNCVPFTFNVGLRSGETKGSVPFDQLPYCTNRAYNICDPKAFSVADRLRCYEECADPCEYTSYNFLSYKNGTSVSGEAGQLGFTVFLRPITADPFVLFASTTKMGAWEFISQIGNVIGIYLGLTGLSIVTFLIKCFHVSRKYYRRRGGRPERKTWGPIMFRLAVMNRMVVQATEKDGEEESDSDQCDPNEDATLESEIRAIVSDLEQIQAEMETFRNGGETNNSFVHKLCVG